MPFFKVKGKRDTWSPYHIPRSVLRAWWCADDHGTGLMTDDGSGVISSWKDRINRLSVDAVTTGRPTWAAAAFNSAYAGLTFDGTANRLIMASLDALIPSGSATSTIIVVCDPRAIGSAAETAISYGGNNTSQRRQIFRTSQANSSLVEVNDNSSTYEVGSVSAWTIPTVLIGQFEAALLSVWQDGTSLGTDDGALNTVATKLVIGANAANTPAAFFGGPIRHVIILAAALSTALRQQLEGYLAWDSGLVSALPSSHPYKLVRP